MKVLLMVMYLGFLCVSCAPVVPTGVYHLDLEVTITDNLGYLDGYSSWHCTKNHYCVGRILLRPDLGSIEEELRHILLNQLAWEGHTN